MLKKKNTLLLITFDVSRINRHFTRKKILSTHSLLIGFKRIALFGHRWKQTEHPPQDLTDFIVIALFSELNILIFNGQYLIQVPQDLQFSKIVIALYDLLDNSLIAFCRSVERDTSIIESKN